jgi:hypothetical protein
MLIPEREDEERRWPMFSQDTTNVHRIRNRAFVISTFPRSTTSEPRLLT